MRCLLLLTLAALVLPAPALADEEDERALFEWERDEGDVLTAAAAPSLEVAPALSLAWTDAGEVRAAGFVLVSGSFDALVEAPVPDVPAPRPSGAELTRLLHADPRFVTRLMRAALDAHASAAFEADVEDAATRARLAGLVPELKLRIARQVDEDQALAPTEYDPDRLTARGGVSTWLEARATFDLDHLVFAGDEPGLLRLTLDRAKFERDLLADVASAFGAWQRARAAAARSDATEEEREAALLASIVEGSKLDALTGGFFSAQLDPEGDLAATPTVGAMPALHRAPTLRARERVEAVRSCARSDGLPRSEDRRGELDALHVALHHPVGVGDGDGDVELLAE